MLCSGLGISCKAWRLLEQRDALIKEEAPAGRGGDVALRAAGENGDVCGTMSCVEIDMDDLVVLALAEDGQRGCEALAAERLTGRRLRKR